MNIGDRVRLIHGKEEGIIRKLLSGGEVEIEIEDGFRIPVLLREVVLVSPVEAQRMVKSEKTVHSVSDLPVARTSGVFADKGIFIAFEPVNDREVTVQLINNTDWILPYTANAQQEGSSKGLACGVLEARTLTKLTELYIKDFETWPVLDIQLLYFRLGAGSNKDPFRYKLRCRANTFFNKKSKAPLINKDAYLYQIDAEANVNAANLKEVLSSGKEKALPVITEILGAVDSEIDLHIEKLTDNFASLNGREIMELQLSVFENTLEKAIAAGMDSITFIHGIGSGSLKNAIHKTLGAHKNVSYFKDAKKEKFGYGATWVALR